MTVKDFKIFSARMVVAVFIMASIGLCFVDSPIRLVGIAFCSVIIVVYVTNCWCSVIETWGK